MTSTLQATGPRHVTAAESYTPELLQRCLVRLEKTQHSLEVWRLIVEVGRSVSLPFVDFVSTEGLQDWRRTLFLRTSYDSSWLTEEYRDDEARQWSILRQHAQHHLTPLLVGLEFIDESPPVPEQRRVLLEAAAARGMRAGISFPLRQNAPPRAGLLTFSGDHSRRGMRAIVRAHGWALHAIALIGHQRYLHHFTQEFFERNHVTAKQRELLELVGRGLQDKQIAERLGISVSAVRQRMSALSTRTGLTSRTEMAALAMSLGILPDPAGRAISSGAMDMLVEMDGFGARSRVSDAR
ncbi:hypothetical protein OCH239_07795 [Roseivivax halodurans JCM 10272]|uniref:HTH luxR-type domain-containing protein n=1 Tax=Roseivivax halodurans JCM 10272 TaxID=1449350 RepID=X7EK41_9RHOB|nr:LuxR family transcriptional regulator [Roseivivax halodurans]ETX16255.1 hypothetical protein OCH239_07795 [Roseivivax halodurans JCM 10272]